MSRNQAAFEREIEEYYDLYQQVNNAGKATEVDIDALLELVDLPYAELRTGAPLIVRSTRGAAESHFREGFKALDASGYGPLEIPHKKMWPLGPDLALLSVDYVRRNLGGGEPLSGRVLYFLRNESGRWKYVFYVYLEPGYEGPDPTPASGGSAFTGLKAP